MIAQGTVHLAFRPALANIVTPQLLAAGCDVFVVATAKGLVTDVGRLKRLIKVSFMTYKFYLNHSNKMRYS